MVWDLTSAVGISQSWRSSSLWKANEPLHNKLKQLKVIKIFLILNNYSILLYLPHKMRESGIVIKIDGKIATVELPKSEACERCRACSLGAGGMMCIEVENRPGAKVGDRVEIEISEGFVVRSLLLIYIGPVAALFIGYFLGALISEGIGIALALIFVVLYLLILRLSDKMLAAQGKRASRIVKIL